MILSDLKLYLQTTYSNPKLDFEWTTEDNIKFFTYMNKNVPKNYLFDDENIQIIEQAFKEYFENVGYIIFQLNDNQISLKVCPYKIHPKDSVYLEDIVDIIQSNKSLIESNYLNNPNQILIIEELKKKLDELIDNDDEKISKKELIKYAVRISLELKINDIIIVKEDKIFIKLVSKIKKSSISVQQKDTIANRYNGIDESELISFYNEYFSKENRINFFRIVANIFGNKYFINSIMDNIEYEKNAFKYMQDIIIEQLEQNFDSSEEFFKGFSGYVFRIHFHEAFEYLSDFILYQLSISNAKIINFLKYYSLKIVIINGEKYRVPELKGSNDLTWNITSMITVAQTHIKAKEFVEELQKTIHDLDDAQYNMFIDGMSPIEYNQELLMERTSVTEDITQIGEEYKAVSNEFHTAKIEKDRIILKEELEDIKSEITSLKETRKNISAALVDNFEIAQYKKFGEDINKIEKHIKSKLQVIQTSEKTYKIIKSILAQALISKKKKI